MHGRRALLTGLAVVAVVGSAAVLVTRGPGPGTPRCLVTTGTGAGTTTYTLTPEQAGNAATIGAVGGREGIPAHAVTVALATALQESGLRNLRYGDRDSAGLFQQRPSQGWGTYDQVTDPAYAAAAFYGGLRRQPGWQTLSVTDAAQQVQRSAAPLAYARWEDEGRAIAVALTGQRAAALACADVPVVRPAADLAATATRELGTAALSGPQPAPRRWELAAWLVAHAQAVGVDAVSCDGRTWTARRGTWVDAAAHDGRLSLHRVTPSA